MSETLLLTILSISELAVVTTVVAVFLFLRNRRMAQEITDSESIQAPAAENPDKAQAELKFTDYLRQNIEQTQEILPSMTPEKAKVLQTRLAFLEAETQAQQHAQNSDAYWDQLISGMDGLLPQASLQQDNGPEEISSEPEEADNPLPILNELDDIDVGNAFEAIPTLEDNIGAVKKDPSLTIESANQDIERLRKIISRQHNTMDELKKSLSEKDIDIEGNQELNKKLEEVEVAQAQLNMCVETLEKENERLNELIKEYEDSPQQEQLILAKQELEVANERISDLEKENTLQAERMTELESEIAELEKALEQRNEELSRLQSNEADLSQTEDSETHNQDSLMKEIESLTDLITQKSEELSKLQNSDSDEFDFIAEMPESDDAEPQPGKAAG